MTADHALAELPEDWHRALAVVAHPDDVEYGGAAAIARWTGQGKQVVYLLITKGEAGIDSMTPDEARRVRVAEQVDSAKVVGVDQVEFLDHPDGMIEPSLALRRDIASAIRRHRPEMLITLNHRETFGTGAQNMADHRVVGQAVIDAARDAGNRWVFTDLLTAGLEPWAGVRHVAVLSSPFPTHAVDVTDHLDAGVESLRRHAAYLDGLGDPDLDPDAFLRDRAEAIAGRFGGRPGVSLELLTM